MRILWIFTLFLINVHSIQAQSPRPDTGVPLQWNRSQSASELIDTLDDYVQRASGAVLYGSMDGGFVNGTGFFDNMGTFVHVSAATGMHYDGIANAHVTELLCWFGDISLNGKADTVWGEVWSVKADTTVDQLLGSGFATTDSLVGSTAFVYSTFKICNGNGYTGGDPFLVAINYKGIDDTLGIISSQASTNDGKGEKRLRQLASPTFGSAWMAAESLWGPLDCDAFIVPVIDDSPAGFEEQVDSGGLRLLGNFPNPATRLTHIRFALNQCEEIHVKVFDLAAREVYNSGWNRLDAGEHQISVDLSNEASGAFYYTIRSKNTCITSKIQVIR